MNLYGWTFLGLAWAFIFWLVIFCIRRILHSDQELG